jgi:hypothetical protein
VRPLAAGRETQTVPVSSALPCPPVPCCWPYLYTCAELLRPALALQSLRLTLLQTFCCP